MNTFGEKEVSLFPFLTEEGWGSTKSLFFFFLQIMNMIGLDIEIVVFGVRLRDNGCKELFIRKLIFFLQPDCFHKFD